jgi:hypothetical protein
MMSAVADGACFPVQSQVPAVMLCSVSFQLAMVDEDHVSVVSELEMRLPKR